MNVTHSHPENPEQKVFGRRLQAGEKLEEGDVYNSSSRRWMSVPFPGLVIEDGHGGIFIRPSKEEPLESVTSLVMTVLEGFATPRAVEELRNFARDHHPSCALGSVPACTCGQREAENFLKLLKGTLTGDRLIRPPQPKLTGENLGEWLRTNSLSTGEM